MSKKSEAKAVIESNKMIGMNNLNELMTEINKQRLIREDELAMLLNWPIEKVTKYVLQGVEKGFLLRNRMDHGMGVWIRIKKPGYNSPQPKILPTWRHDCLSIFVLTELLKQKNGILNHTGSNLTIQTELETIKHIKTGKISDGRLLDENGEVIYVVEVEWSEKSAKPMKKMIEYAVAYAKRGIHTIFAYPSGHTQSPFYFKPSPKSKRIDHLKRLGNAINKYFEIYSEAEHLKTCFEFASISFKSEIMLQNARAHTLVLMNIETQQMMDMSAFE